MLVLILLVIFIRIVAPRPERIAFESYRDGNFEIYTMNADGSHQVRLTNNTVDDKDAKISQDGKWIVFTSMRDGNYEIYRMRSDGSQQTRLTNNSTYDTNPALSFDDKRIAYVRGDPNGPNIHVMNFDGTGDVQ